jgi:chromosomal replication initiation ATPase DnaA
MSATVQDIKKTVLFVLAVKESDMLSTSRKTEHALARHMCLELIKTSFGYSLTDCAAVLGLVLDHSTVLNSLGRIDQLRTESKVFNDMYHAVVNHLNFGKPLVLKITSAHLIAEVHALRQSKN